MFCVLSACCIALSLLLPVSAQGAFEKGVALFNKRDYKTALVQFEGIVKKEPKHSTALYYVAICNQYLGKMEAARANYKKILEQFPGTMAARQAETALGLQAPIGFPAHLSTPSAPQSNSTATSGLSGPQQDSSVFIDASQRGHMLVPATINGRSMKMLIDTGTSYCLLGKNHLKELGVPEPTGPATGKAYTSTGRPYNVWQVPLEIQVGSTKKRVTVNVQDKQEWEPLLGWSFFRGQMVLINSTRGQLQFSKSTPRDMPPGAASTQLDVDATNITVRVKVNGMETAANLDTGGQLCRVFKTDSSRLGVTAPANAQPYTSKGEDGGAYKVTPTMIGNITVGNLSKDGVKANIVDAGSGRPALGMSFLSDFNILLDIDGKRATFWR